MKRDQFTFYRSYYEALKNLPEKERAKVLFAIMEYALDEQEPNNLEGVCAACFLLIRPTLDSGRIKAANRKNKTKTNEEQNENKTETKLEQKPKEREKEKEREVECEREKEREKEREVERENDSSPLKPPAAARRFTPPTVDEVAAYCRERRNGVDAQRFVDFYASKGWKVGTSPMKDWHAAVRNWEGRDNRTPAAGAGGTAGNGPMLKHDYTQRDFESMSVNLDEEE